MKSTLYLKLIDNIKTIIYALVIAIIIRSFFFQPFFIPSSSMEPNLLVGDRLFVSKYTYGYSKHSFPFSPPLFRNRVFDEKPSRGEVIVFKTPADNRTDYIKRLIGLPGDKIQFINGDLFINDVKIKRKKTSFNSKIRCGSDFLETNIFIETLPNGKSHLVAYKKKGSLLNTDIYNVPMGYYFFLGDNRDCSKDSRFLGSVGYVKHVNLVGKASIIFFSNESAKGYFIQFWKWGNSMRLNRFFKKIK